MIRVVTLLGALFTCFCTGCSGILLVNPLCDEGSFVVPESLVGDYVVSLPAQHPLMTHVPVVAELGTRLRFSEEGYLEILFRELGSSVHSQLQSTIEDKVVEAGICSVGNRFYLSERERDSGLYRVLELFIFERGFTIAAVGADVEGLRNSGFQLVHVPATRSLETENGFVGSGISQESKFAVFNPPGSEQRLLEHWSASQLSLFFRRVPSSHWQQGGKRAGGAQPWRKLGVKVRGRRSSARN